MPKESLTPAKTSETVSSLVANFSRVRDLLGQIVEPYMTEKNHTHLKELFLYIGSNEFVTMLMFDEKAAKSKAKMAAALRTLLKFKLEEEEAIAKAGSE